MIWLVKRLPIEQINEIIAAHPDLASLDNQFERLYILPD